MATTLSAAAPSAAAYFISAPISSASGLLSSSSTPMTQQQQQMYALIPVQSPIFPNPAFYVSAPAPISQQSKPVSTPTSAAQTYSAPSVAKILPRIPSDILGADDLELLRKMSFTNNTTATGSTGAGQATKETEAEVSKVNVDEGELVSCISMILEELTPEDICSWTMDVTNSIDSASDCEDDVLSVSTVKSEPVKPTLSVKVEPASEQKLYTTSSPLPMNPSSSSRSLSPKPKVLEKRTSLIMVENLFENLLGKQREVGSRKNRKRCAMDGCTRRSRSWGMCKAHSLVTKCSIDGCNRQSQGNRLCIRHGGGKRCEISGCTRAAQSKSRCKAHGGGVRCKIDGCSRSSQGGGLCRAHGGGPRCQLEGCNDRTVPRTSYCNKHQQ